MENITSFHIEKEIPEDSDIISDYEMIKEIYIDDIKEITNNNSELYFLLKLKYEIEIENSTKELISSMKLDDLLNCSNSSCMYLPYWIKFDYSKEIKTTLKISFFIFWLKVEPLLKNEIEQSISNDICEPYLYNIIEETKNKIDTTLKNKDIIINILSEIREMKVLELHSTTDNLLLSKTGANEDINDFEYEEHLKTKHSVHKNHNKNDKEKNEIIKENNNSDDSDNNESNEENSKYSYDKFFEDGGVASEIIEVKKSKFQAHIIKVKNMEEVDFYKKCVLSRRKIKKATHNISVFRFSEENSKIINENYDDDGEGGAGERLLFVIQKMKLNNLLVIVTRWFGGVLMYGLRFTTICDTAQNLINQHKDLFN